MSNNPEIDLPDVFPEEWAQQEPETPGIESITITHPLSLTIDVALELEETTDAVILTVMSTNGTVVRVQEDPVTGGILVTRDPDSMEEQARGPLHITPVALGGFVLDDRA